MTEVQVFDGDGSGKLGKITYLTQRFVLMHENRREVKLPDPNQDVNLPDTSISGQAYITRLNPNIWAISDYKSEPFDPVKTPIMYALSNLTAKDPFIVFVPAIDLGDTMETGYTLFGCLLNQIQHITTPAGVVIIRNILTVERVD